MARLLMLGSVVALALVLLSFKKAHPGAKRIERVVAPAHVKPAQFRRIRLGMKVAQVRELLGVPDESARAGGQLCWDYGTPLSRDGMYAVCFRRGKVSYKSRTSYRA
jgi:outer membrane protein assembly factor BamE (lipoprotein component of BamABCDE complex)